MMKILNSNLQSCVHDCGNSSRDRGAQNSGSGRGKGSNLSTGNVHAAKCTGTRTVAGIEINLEQIIVITLIEKVNKGRGKKVLARLTVGRDLW